MKYGLSHLFRAIFAMMAVMSFTSCATMFSGFKANIFIEGDVEEPVNITSSAGDYKNVTLPAVIEVKRRQLNGQHIQISSEHHQFDDIVLEKTLNVWAIGSALFYFTPLCVDLLTNAVSKPKYDHFYITPLSEQLITDSLYQRRPTVMVSTMSQATRNRLKSEQLPQKYPRHEINGTFGFGPNQTDRLTDRFMDGILTPRNMESEAECGDIFGDSYIMAKVEYHYRLNRKWDIGIMAAWGYSSESYTNWYWYTEEEHTKNTPFIVTTGYQSCRTFSLAPSVRYTWYETPTFRFFSRVSAGMLRHHLHADLTNSLHESLFEPPASRNDEYEDDIRWRMAYQISPFCINVGLGPLRFVAELGYGCLGVFNFGIGFNF